MSMMRAGDASRWFGLAPQSPADTQVFVFPYAGGSAASFQGWQGPGLALHVALMPARGVRMQEPPVDDLAKLVEQLADAVVERATGPFLLFGHSLGALVAFEVARELRRRNAPEPLALLVSGAEAPQTRLVRRPCHHLGDDALIAALRDFGGTPKELLADRELMEIVLPAVRADFALSERYVYRPEPPLDLPVHVLLGDADEHVEFERAAGWALETTAPPQQHVFAGGHFFLIDHQAEIVGIMRQVAAWRIDETRC